MERNKGKCGEREFARELSWLLDGEARRGAQFRGGPESPDVVTPNVEGIHWEVKRCESLSLYVAMKQAVGDAGSDEVPVVAHRRNKQEWLVVLRLSDLRRLVKILSKVLL